ncbi:MAG: RsmB/NOP family class I SAM-dependent RNA methyltransferase [Pseudomonadota bacterium]
MDRLHTDARVLALELTLGVTEDRRTLAELEATLDAAPETRARAGRLTRATLRQVARADRALKPFLARPPQTAIRAILRLATVEMLSEGGPPHAVVDAAVRMARKRHAKAAGMVNAVLRKVAALPPEAWASGEPQRLPKWLRGRLGAAYGNARVAAMEQVFEAPPPLDITLKPGEDAPAWADKLGADLLPTGSLRRTVPGQVSAAPGFGAGAWWVQDAAAALPATLLAPGHGDRVLDLCAAPGGKTLQLAAAGAQVTALDISEPRLVRLRENLARTDLSADIVVADALHHTPPVPFDAVLIDAPCSATGTIRRHPDLPFARDGADLSPLTQLQEALIDRAIGWVRPGGHILFCTCSLLPEEGEIQAERMAARHPGVRFTDRPGVADPFRIAPGQWRITPEIWADRGGIDGFFIALAQVPTAGEVQQRNGTGD